MAKRISPIWKMDSKTFCEIITKSTSMREALAFFGLRAGSYNTLVERLEKENIDISHFVKNKQTKKSLSEILVVGSDYSRTNLKKRLIANGILKDECSECGLGNQWNNKSMTLVLDHKNGVNNDNRLENLRLLCPNCNSQTDTFCSRNRRKKQNTCKDCGSPVRRCAIKCAPCYMGNKKVKTLPEPDLLFNEVREFDLLTVSKKYDISTLRIRKILGKNFPQWEDMLLKENLNLARVNKILTTEKTNGKFKTCKSCSIPFKGKGNDYCSMSCCRLSSRRVERPSKEDLEKMVLEIPVIQIGRRFGVTGNAVVKWCKQYGIAKPGVGFWQKKRKLEKQE